MTAGITSYRKLEVWQFSMDWIELVYRSSAGWPKDERFGLTSQVRRAAVSIASNIAEGAARRTTGEFLWVDFSIQPLRDESGAVIRRGN